MALLGFHRVASSLLYEIERNDPELLRRTLVIDFNVALHAEIEKRGATAHYGDISNPETLRHAGVDKARIVVCTISDDVLKGTSNLQLARTLRQMAPAATIIVNAVQVADAKTMREAGADHVFLARLDSAANLVGAIDAALSGSIKDFGSSHAAKFGPLDRRREVLPRAAMRILWTGKGTTRRPRCFRSGCRVEPARRAWEAPVVLDAYI